MEIIKIALYGLAVLTSVACCVLLFRGYMQKRTRLLMWSALCFVGLTAANIFLFLDLVLLPGVDLRVPRIGSALVGVLLLLYGFIWEVE